MIVGLIRMWDFQVEKRDLNKAGVPSPVLRTAAFYTPPQSLPCQAVVADRRGQPLLCRYFMPMDGRRWLVRPESV